MPCISDSHYPGLVFIFLVDTEEDAMVVHACLGKGICLCCTLKICQVMGETIERLIGHKNASKLDIVSFFTPKRYLDKRKNKYFYIRRLVLHIIIKVESNVFFSDDGTSSGNQYKPGDF